MPAIKVSQHDEEIVEIEFSLDESAPQISLRAFCCPSFSSVTNRKVSLFGFLVTNTVSENALKAPEKTNCGYFSYRLFAKVIDTRNSRVQLGDIDVVLDCPIPKDILPNSYISFDVMRLDLQY